MGADYCAVSEGGNAVSLLAEEFGALHHAAALEDAEHIGAGLSKADLDIAASRDAYGAVGELLTSKVVNLHGVVASRSEVDENVFAHDGGRNVIDLRRTNRGDVVDLDNAESFAGRAISVGEREGHVIFAALGKGHVGRTRAVVARGVGDVGVARFPRGRGGHGIACAGDER